MTRTARSPSISMHTMRHITDVSPINVCSVMLKILKPLMDPFASTVTIAAIVLRLTSASAPTVIPLTIRTLVLIVMHMRLTLPGSLVPTTSVMPFGRQRLTALGRRVPPRSVMPNFHSPTRNRPVTAPTVIVFRPPAITITMAEATMDVLPFWCAIFPEHTRHQVTRITTIACIVISPRPTIWSIPGRLVLRGAVMVHFQLVLLTIRSLATIPTVILHLRRNTTSIRCKTAPPECVMNTGITVVCCLTGILVQPMCVIQCRRLKMRPDSRM